MKRNPTSLLLSAWLLAAAVSIGGAFCLGTAFRLPGPDAGLALALCLGSLAMALLQAAPRGWFWTLLAWLLGGGVAAARYGRAVYDSFRLVLASVSRLFAGAYPGFPSVELGGAIPAAASARPFLLVLGLLLAQLLAWTVMRRQSAVPALLFGILPVVLTHLLTDMPPAQWALLSLIGGLCLLLMTQSARVRSPVGGGRLTLYLAPPLAALLLALSLVIPQAGYTRRAGAEQLQDRLLSAWAQLSGSQNSGSLSGQLALAQPDTIPLGLVGPQIRTHTPVLEVTAEEAAVLYLRGKAYDLYDGRSWSIGPETEHAPSGGFQTGGRYAGLASTYRVSIRTRRAGAAAYVPYYPGAGTLAELEPWGDAYLRSGGQEAYSVTYVRLPDGQTLPTAEAFTAARALSDTLLNGADPVYEAYVLDRDLQLPEETYQGVRQYMQEHAVPSDPEGIAAYLRSCARYDLRTPRAPGDQDFVLWFLRESDTGYCVHFASAAAVMLRASGYPARCVTGFVADCRAGQTVTVTDDTAHAWAEYYQDGDWIPLDATPGEAVRTSPEETVQPSEPTLETPTAERPVRETTGSDHPAAPGQTVERPQGQVSAGLRSLPPWVKAAGAILGGLLGAALALCLRRQLVLRARRACLTRGSRNRRCLGQWRLLQRQARAAGRSVPGEVERIALKARFSQHEISPEELGTVLTFQDSCAAEIRKARLLRRLYAQYVLVLC